MQTPKFWANLGYISKINSTKYRQGLTVKFAVDGLEDTNHLYRRKVNWGKVWANMTAYSQAGGFGIWNFIIFKHNEHQIDQALKKAKELNLPPHILITDNEMMHIATARPTTMNQLLEKNYINNEFINKNSSEILSIFN